MKERIVILTNLKEFNPGYSLSGIILDQYKMLTKYGHSVHLIVSEEFEGDRILPVFEVMPKCKLIDYKTKGEVTQEHKEVAEKTCVVLKEVLTKLETDIVIAHDIMFQGWFVPFYLGVLKVTPLLPKVRWLNWTHSIPTNNKDWWDIRLLRPNHKIIYPNNTDRLHVARQFRGLFEDTRCIHHIKDYRSWGDFDSDTCDFIEQYPAVMQADVVQIYPAGCDRLGAKRVSELLQIFGNIKKMKYSVCLIVANQWATTNVRRQDIERYKVEARARGLEVGKEFIFTSDFKYPKYDLGIPKRMVRELMSLSNLFIFPTRDETFGLVLPEVSLSGGCLLVLNKSLEMLYEISGGNALFYDFGSFNRPFSLAPEGDAYYERIAREIMAKMTTNEAVRAKSYIRQVYNYDSLYKHEYNPLFKESENWIK